MAAGGEETHGKNAIQPEQHGHDAPAQIFGKSYPTYCYTDALVQYPTVFTAFYTFIPLILALLSITVSPDVDLSPDAFSIRDHWSALHMRYVSDARQAWIATVQQAEQAGRAAAAAAPRGVPHRPNIRSRLYVQYEIDAAAVVAYTRSGSNASGSTSNNTGPEDLLSAANVEYIHRIEAAIQRLDRYTALCWRAPFRGASGDAAYVSYGLPACTPLNSLMTYFYVGGLENATGIPYWALDGATGVQQQPHDRVRDLVFNNPRFQWFMDQRASRDDRRTTLLRTQVQLGAPVFTSSGSPMSQSGVDRLTDTFVNEFIRLLGDDLPAHPYIRVTFGGDHVESTIALKALSRDANLVIPAAVFMFLALWVHFHSVVLALFAMVQVGLTYPAALFIYAACSGDRSISLLTTLSVFATLVIATDAMMIFFDTFKHSGFMATTGRRNLLSISQRIAYTLRKAGVGTTVASLVAACCFGVASTSKVPAVRSFALIMVSLVCVNWFVMMTLFPAALLFHHFHISGRRRNLQRQKEILLARGLRRRDPNVVLFLQQLEALNERVGVTTYKAAAEYMAHERESAAAKRVGLLNSMGLAGAMPRLRNPFRRRRLAAPTATDGGEYNEELDAEVDAQARLDEFPDAAPTAASPKQAEAAADATAAAQGRFDRHNLDLAATLRIRNINNDELLGFDDSRLRYKLMELGAHAPADFTDAQIAAVAPLLGIEAQGPKAEGRLATAARMAICLMYGGGRSLHDSRPLPAPTEQPPAAADGGAAAAAAAAGPKRSGMAGWWDERRSVQRRWCCGLCGQRVDETPAEQEARILAKRVKHDGYSRLELLFFNKWAPAVNAARFVIVVLGAAWLIAAIVLAARLQPARDPPELLGDSPLEAYHSVRPRFGAAGTCDYCSAYFRSLLDFPAPDVGAVQSCGLSSNTTASTTQNAPASLSMFAYRDACGVCYGSNDCIDCLGTVNGSYRVDACGQCLHPAGPRFNGCRRCTGIGTMYELFCSQCFLVEGRATPYSTGRDCLVYCHPNDNCRPEHGRCNAVTGECECHRSFAHGWFTSDPRKREKCTECLAGFHGLDCRTECVSASNVPCACNVTRGRCTGCLPGLVGQDCFVVDPAVCDPVGGIFVDPIGCTCNPNYGGPACAYHRSCSYHGKMYPAALLPPGAANCTCAGQWRGPECQYCLCYNGGTCAPDGTCVCSGGWDGPTCERCAGTCLAHGACALPYEPRHYPAFICRAIYCTDRELQTNTATTFHCIRCGAITTRHALCSPHDRNATACGTANGYNCAYDVPSRTCRSKQHDPFIETNYTHCRCNGHWATALCNLCATTVRGTHCNTQGEIVGCDGQPARNGQYRVINNCGVCGGGACLGCDGIPGSTKVLDRCGVCGGFNECAAAAAANGGTIVTPTAEVFFIAGIADDGSADPDFNFADRSVQEHLRFICDVVTHRERAKTEQSSCIVPDFARWVDRTRAVYFPVALDIIPGAHHLLFDYVSATGRWDEVGFSGMDPAAPDFRVTWILLKVRTRDVHERASEAQHARGLKEWSALLDVANRYASALPLGTIRMASPAWVNLYTQRASRKGAVFVLAVGGLLFLVVLLAATASPTLTIAGCLTLTSNVVTVLAFFWIFQWDLGPVELVGLSLLTGLTGEQLIHMSEGYLEYLHASQSHMLARETTRLQAVKGMYQRTGVSTLLSGVTIVASALVLFAARIVVIRRVAHVVVLLVVSQLLHGLVLFGAILCVVGPVASYRSRLTSFIFCCVGLVVFTVVFLALFLTHTVVLVD